MTKDAKVHDGLAVVGAAFPQPSSPLAAMAASYFSDSSLCRPNGPLPFHAMAMPLLDGCHPSNCCQHWRCRTGRWGAQAGQYEGFGLIEFATYVAADRILQTYNGQGMLNSKQVFRLNKATWGACGK
ncbi:hypothetical protein ZIOFF_033573 [Zingiber officinale]|uniref:Uncharacterized protein n=1 Tax=Zingiber officinale TaxID=94328 RepID=A0A8J5GKH5_ZINOF|nr:hypothetical protein ZIOFF_033573 [Zingiber officinale]